MQIFLIGMMGCGKTTIGSKLASKLMYNFIDIDKIIELKCHLTIHEIIDRFGVSHFRKLEYDVLTQLNLTRPTVFSTGGGIILDDRNCLFMKQKGTIIYLKVSIKELEKRLIGSEQMKRPLLKSSTVKEIYESRKTIYENISDLTVNCDNLTEDEITSNIITLLKKRMTI